MPRRGRMPHAGRFPPSRLAPARHRVASGGRCRCVPSPAVRRGSWGPRSRTVSRPNGGCPSPLPHTEIHSGERCAPSLVPPATAGSGTVRHTRSPALLPRNNAGSRCRRPATGRRSQSRRAGCPVGSRWWGGASVCRPPSPRNGRCRPVRLPSVVPLAADVPRHESPVAPSPDGYRRAGIRHPRTPEPAVSVRRWKQKTPPAGAYIRQELPVIPKCRSAGRWKKAVCQSASRGAMPASVPGRHKAENSRVWLS